MGWVKVDDHWPQHPKALAAGKDGRALILGAWCWTASNQTDGVIPREAVGGIAGFADVGDIQATVDRLVAVGLWKPQLEGFEVHDWLTYNVSRADYERRRAAEIARLADYRAKRAAERAAKDDTP